MQHRRTEWHTPYLPAPLVRSGRRVYHHIMYLSEGADGASEREAPPVAAGGGGAPAVRAIRARKLRTGSTSTSSGSSTATSSGSSTSTCQGRACAQGVGRQPRALTPRSFPTGRGHGRCANSCGEATASRQQYACCRRKDGLATISPDAGCVDPQPQGAARAGHTCRGCTSGAGRRTAWPGRRPSWPEPD